MRRERDGPAPLGCAVYRSGWFPRWLGSLLVFGAASYVASFTSTVLTPGFVESDLALILAMPAALAEVSFVLWLLVRGVRAGRLRGGRSEPRHPGDERLGRP
jgi:hypothetical protein